MEKRNAQVKNIWMVTREYGDLAGAGGVKDVAAQLSRALAKWSGRKVSVVLPHYGFIDTDSLGFTPLHDPLSRETELVYGVNMDYVDEERNETVRVWYKKEEKVNLYLLDSPRFHEKLDVYTYTEKEEQFDPEKRRGVGHYDYFAMNLLLQKGALQLLLFLQEKPDVLHCHDGHTAVIPAMIAENPWLRAYFRATGVLVTVHNAGKGYHQEVADLPFAQVMTGLPWRSVLKSRLQGNFDPFVSAGLYGVVNTVSENYARELQETNEDEQTGWLGHHWLDMGVKLEGITNGVDPQTFDPRRGEEIGLPASYNPRDDTLMAGKNECKQALLQQLSVERLHAAVTQYGFLATAPDKPLFTFVGRLSEQKGVDILLAALQENLLGRHDFRMVILGSGTSAVEEELVRIVHQENTRGQLCFIRGYSAELAMRLYSAGDFFVIPSRYEPCGLTDFIAQLFANLPIVHSVGGLVKVIDEETGFSYAENTSQALAETMERAIIQYADKPSLRSMQKRAVALIEEKYTWKVVMSRYLQLYKQARIQH